MYLFRVLLSVREVIKILRHVKNSSAFVCLLVCILKIAFYENSKSFRNAEYHSKISVRNLNTLIKLSSEAC